GYGPEDVAAALRASYAQEREEHLFEHGNEPTRRERILNWATGIGLIANAGSWTALFLGATQPWLPSVVLVSSYWSFTGLLSATTARKRTDADSWWAKRW